MPRLEPECGKLRVKRRTNYIDRLRYMDLQYWIGGDLRTFQRNVKVFSIHTHAGDGRYVVWHKNAAVMATCHRGHGGCVMIAIAPAAAYRSMPLAEFDDIVLAQVCDPTPAQALTSSILAAAAQGLSDALRKRRMQDDD